MQEPWPKEEGGRMQTRQSYRSPELFLYPTKTFQPVKSDTRSPS